MAEENIKKLLEDYKQDTTRHFDVVAESLKHEIQLVAEGVSTANERIDILQGDVTGIKENVANLEVEVVGIKDEMVGIKDEMVGIKDEIVGVKDKMEVMEVDISTIKIDVEFIKNELIQKVSREEFAFLEKRVSAMETKLHQKA